MMTTMQKIGVRAAVLLCGAGLVVASATAQDQTSAPPPDGQQQGPPLGGMRGGMRGGGSPEMRASMLQKQLGLTDDVTAQVKAIFMDGTAKMQALRDSSSSPEDRRSQMMAIRQAETTKVNALLTPDQQTKYAAMEARMRQRGPGGPPPDGGAPPPPPPPQ